jgi:hypothetical protein
MKPLPTLVTKAKPPPVAVEVEVGEAVKLSAEKTDLPHDATPMRKASNSAGARNASDLAK